MRPCACDNKAKAAGIAGSLVPEMGLEPIQP